MAPESFDAVVAGLYKAAAGQENWGVALAHLSEALDAWAAQLIGIDKRDGSLLFNHDGGRAPPEAALDYVRHYHQQNPRVPATLALAPGQWMHDDEVFDDAFVASSPFYQEFLIPYGGGWLSGVKLIDDEEQLVIFGALRAADQRPFNLDERAELERLRHPLTAAVRIQTGRKVTHDRAVTGALLLISSSGRCWSSMLSAVSASPTAPPARFSHPRTTCFPEATCSSAGSGIPIGHSARRFTSFAWPTDFDMPPHRQTADSP